MRTDGQPLTAKDVASSNNTLNALLGGRQKAWMNGGGPVRPSPRPQRTPSTQSQQIQPAPALNNDQLHIAQQSPAAGVPSSGNRQASDHHERGRQLQPLSIPHNPSPQLSRNNSISTTQQAPHSTSRNNSVSSVTHVTIPNNNYTHPPTPTVPMFLPRQEPNGQVTVLSPHATQAEQRLPAMDQLSMQSPQYPPQATQWQYHQHSPPMQSPNAPFQGQMPYGQVHSQPNAAAQAPQRQDQQSQASRQGSSNFETSMKSHIPIIEAHIAKYGGIRALSQTLEQPRFMLLRDACKNEDQFYVALHQVFCSWTMDPSSLKSIPSYNKTTIQAFATLGQLIKTNDNMAPPHLSFFASFPGDLLNLFVHSDQYKKRITEVIDFLNKLSTEWPGFTKVCHQRGYPPLVDELISYLGLLSPILQGVVFTATRRNLGIIDDELGNQMENLFAQDRDGHAAFAKRMYTDHPPTNEEVSGRNLNLITSYQAIAHQRTLQSATPSQQSPGVLQYAPLVRQQSGHSTTQRPHVLTSNNPLDQNGSPTVYNGAQPPPQLHVQRQYSQGYRQNLHLQSHSPQNMQNLPPTSSNQIQGPVSGVSPTMQQQRHGVQSQQVYERELYEQEVQRHYNNILMSQQSNHDRIAQIAHNQRLQQSQQSQRGQQAQITPPQLPSVAYSQTSQLQQQLPQRRYITQHRRPGRQPSQSQLAVPSLAAIPAGGALPTPPIVSSSPILSPWKQDPFKIDQYNKQNPLERQVVPPLGWSASQAPPDPMMTAIHQAYLRSPTLSVKDSEPIPNSQLTMRHYQMVREFAVEPIALSRNTRIFACSFTIPDSFLPKLAKVDRKDRGIEHPTGTTSITAGSLRYRMRCVALNSSSVIQQADWVVADCIWPQHVFIELNKMVVEVRRKNHHGKDLPVDMMSFLSTIPGKEQTIDIASLPPGSNTKHMYFGFAVEVVEVLNHKQILEMVTQNQRIPAREMIANISASLSGSLDDDEIAMIVSDLTIDLADPFMARIFSIPVRGMGCLHRECFDLETFLMTRNAKPKSSPGEPCMVDVWKCPLCGKDARPYSLRVDDFLVSVRDKLEADGLLDTKAILVAADGSWKPKRESQPAKRSASAAGMAEDEEDDDWQEKRIKYRATSTPSRPQPTARQIEVISLDDDF